jgi:hypothetical protein
VSSVLGLRQPTVSSTPSAQGPEALLSDLQELLFMVRPGGGDVVVCVDQTTIRDTDRVFAFGLTGTAWTHQSFTMLLLPTLQFKSGGRSLSAAQEAESVSNTSGSIPSEHPSHQWDAAIAQEQQLAAAWLATWAEANPVNCSKLLVRVSLACNAKPMSVIVHLFTVQAAHRLTFWFSPVQHPLQ